MFESKVEITSIHNILDGYCCMKYNSKIILLKRHMSNTSRCSSSKGNTINVTFISNKVQVIPTIDMSFKHLYNMTAIVFHTLYHKTIFFQLISIIFVAYTKHVQLTVMTAFNAKPANLKQKWRSQYALSELGLINCFNFAVLTAKYRSSSPKVSKRESI